jgi:hypothetical protein
MGAAITHSAGTIVPLSMTVWSVGSEARTIMHPILGRRDDDVTFRPAGLRRGTLTFVFASAAAAVAARAVLVVPQQFELAHSDVPEVDMSFVVAGGDVGEVIGNALEWSLTIPFCEVLP